MLGPYCRSKWRAEEAAAEAAQDGDPVVIVRPSIPVGPGDRHLGPPTRMICDFCNGRIKGHLDGDLNFIDVRDIAAGIRAAAQHGLSQPRWGKPPSCAVPSTNSSKRACCARSAAGFAGRFANSGPRQPSNHTTHKARTTRMGPRLVRAEVPGGHNSALQNPLWRVCLGRSCAAFCSPPC